VRVANTAAAGRQKRHHSTDVHIKNRRQRLSGMGGKKMKVSIILVVMLLSGCALSQEAVWRNPSAPHASSSRDLAECEYQASLAPVDQHNIFMAREQSLSRIRQCMALRGWELR